MAVGHAFCRVWGEGIHEKSVTALVLFCYFDYLLIPLLCKRALATGTDIECSIELSKPAVAVGEPVSATAMISGGFTPYREVHYVWWAVTADGNVADISQGTMRSGENVSCTPVWGVELSFSLHVVDALGQPWSFSESIPITGTPSYRFIQTAPPVWESNSQNGLQFTVDANHADFLSIAVDQSIVGDSNYSTAPGSTIITLFPAYLRSLPQGSHVLTAFFNNGYAQTTFHIQAGGASVPGCPFCSGAGCMHCQATPPQTGDRSPLLLLSMLVAVPGFILITRSVQRKRSRRKSCARSM